MGAADKKILVIKMSSLGDVMHTLPAVRTLRANHPGASITWLVEEQYKDLLYNNPDVDEIIVTRTRRWRKNWNLKTWREIRDTVQRLRQSRFDVALDLQGLLKTGVIAWLSGAPKRIGFHRKNCREPINALFTNKRASFVNQGSHVVDIYLNLIKLLGGNQKITQPHALQVPEEKASAVNAFFREQPELSAKPIAAINAGAGFATKQWKLDRFAKLADQISKELGFSILLAWGPGEKAMAEQIAGEMKERSWIAPPTTIQESIALFRHIALLVSCDSGPLHLAAAMGIPTVSIFGPTDPARNGPYGDNHQLVCKELPCSFCWKKQCPLSTHECMETVNVDEVFAAVKTSVSRFGNAAAK